MRPLLIPVIGIFLTLFTTGCRKELPDNGSQDPKNMEELKIASDFNWKTSRDVDFQISSSFATVITILSDDGQVTWYKGYFNGNNGIFSTLVNIPSYISQVKVNGIPANISGNRVEVNLDAGYFKSAMTDDLIPQSGLLASWSFDENGGTTANDGAGTHDGTVSGASWTPGIRGSALDFDGVDGQVLVPNGGNFNPTGGAISFSVWFRMEQVGDDGCLIFQNVKYILKLDAQGRVGFALYTPVYNDVNMSYEERILDTDWHHAAATYDGEEMKLYIDGTLRNTEPNTGNLQTSTSDVYIGKQRTINPFAGIIDEVLVYDRALTAAEVSQIHASTPDPGNGSADLVSWWALNENAGSSAGDSKGNNNGTITGGATWTPGISGSCLHFDGASGNVKVLNASNLNPVNGLTMMAWARTEENKTCKILQKGDWDGHGIGQGKWDGWQVSIRTSDNVSHSIHWGDELPVLNQWYHIALTYDGTILKMYINGQLKNTLAVSGTLKVNTRDLSIGSDNAAQKFFRGDIDECKFFNRALTPTEIQANYNEPAATPDQDGDGIADADDGYPTDPARAFDNFWPASGYGSLAFEDLWPGKGDYDFNDLVLNYRFKTITNAGNKVTEVRAVFAIRAIGAGFSNGFGFQLPDNGLLPADLDVSGSSLLESYITLAANGLEANQEKITIIAFDNVNKLMPSPTGFGVNVDPANPYVDPDTVTLSILCKPNTYAISDFGLPDFNPFLIINLERGKEVHLPDYPPTSLADTSYFGTDQDDTHPSAGRYYKTTGNLPWAINIAENYDYTIEHLQVTTGHLKFATWAESSGTLYPDWFLNKPGYRNTANIYPVP